MIFLYIYIYTGGDPSLTTPECKAVNEEVYEVYEDI